MSAIERTIQVSYELRVHFTHGVFDAANPLLKDVLVNNRPGQIRKALVVLDEALAAAQPELAEKINNYFAATVAAPPAPTARRKLRLLSLPFT